jgi:peptidoglycan/LPS O-acetylase OafA/YrhL
LTAAFPAALTNLVTIMQTLEQKLHESGGKPSGFNYIRIVLAISIIAWHSVLVCYGGIAEIPFYTGPLRPLVHFLVPSFFALSGFLVAGSLERVDNLPTFLTLRFLRIFPALVCEVVISAFLIGAALTTLPLAEYFAHPTFHHYFLNVLGDIQYALPGVFEANPSKVVNIQLWTIPYELKCYILLTLAALVGLHRRPRLFLLLLSVATVILTVINYKYGTFPLGGRPSGRFVVWAFLWGVALFLMRHKIACHVLPFVFSVLAIWFLLRMRETEYLAAPAVAYATVYIGSQDFRKTLLLKAGDISYGLYLYGFAVQQAAYQLLPQHRSWLENFIVSLLVSAVFGYLSWTYVESKVLEYKTAAIRFVLSISGSVRNWVA